jgi:hypothetical protein
MSKQIPAKFYEDGDWNLVEEVLLDCLSQVAYHPESSTAPTDFKAQVLANKRLKTAVDTFLAQAKVIKSQEVEKNPFI